MTEYNEHRINWNDWDWIDHAVNVWKCYQDAEQSRGCLDSDETELWEVQAEWNSILIRYRHAAIAYERGREEATR